MHTMNNDAPVACQQRMLTLRERVKCALQVLAQTWSYTRRNPVFVTGSVVTVSVRLTCDEARNVIR